LIFVLEKTGFYFRYSDDLLLICPKNIAQEVENFVLSDIKELKLTISEEKTNRILFEKSGEKSYSVNKEILIEKNKLGENKEKVLQYLGLEFGQKITIRSASLNKNLNKSLYKIKKYKLKIQNKIQKNLFQGKIFTKKLAELTHFGKTNFYRYAIKVNQEKQIFEKKTIVQTKSKNSNCNIRYKFFEVRFDSKFN